MSAAHRASAPGAVVAHDATGTDLASGDPADRGRTTIADRVVEKVAARAATEVDHTSGLRRSVAGRTVGRPTVRVQADIDGRVAGLRLDLAVAFPVAVRPVTRAVRSHVTARVGELCGMTVDHVDITVAALPRPTADTRRVR